jgi:hypothetical protein
MIIICSMRKLIIVIKICYIVNVDKQLKIKVLEI